VEVQPPVIERKIIGVLMRAAREKSRRSVKQAAERLGVSQARVRQYERGTREISLTELESLALYLQAPLSYFLDSDSSIEEEKSPAPQPEKIKSLRAMIGERLKQARLAASKSREECAKATGVKPGTVGRYERGLGDIPITELERLAKFLGVNLFYFLQDDTGGDDSGEVLDLEKLARLPKETRAFVMNADNMPYLRMAMKFRDLPADKLKELGEILLVVR
jgi:transcriptional regulator with XRE-family HTH domain